MSHRLKLLLLIISIFLIDCCSVRNVHPTPIEAVSRVDHIRASTVAFQAADRDGDLQTYCAGVFIDPFHMVTAKHCLEMAVGDDLKTTLVQVPEPPQATDPSLQPLINQLMKKPLAEAREEAFRKAIGGWIGFKLYGENPKILQDLHWAQVMEMGKGDEQDVALLMIVSPFGHDYVSLRNGYPGDGEEIDIEGHPAREEWVYSKGYISKTHSDDGKMQIQAPIYYGNSGGGAFNKEGELIGICSSFLTNVPDTSFFINSVDIAKLLEPESQE